MRYRTRLTILFSVISFFCFVIVPLRVFEIQILGHEHYKQMVEERRIRQDPVNAPRGKVLTRDGVVLASEHPAYDLKLHFRVIVDKKDKERERESRLMARLPSLVGLTSNELAGKLEQLRETVIRDRLKEARAHVNAGIRLVGFKYRLAREIELKPTDAARIQEELPEGTFLKQFKKRKWFFFRRNLDEYDLRVDFARLKEERDLPLRLAKALRLDPADLSISLRESREKLDYKILRRSPPRTLIANLPYETMLRVAVNEDELPGVQVASRPIRHFPEKALFAHTVGSLTEPREEQLKEWLRDSDDVWIRRWARSGVKPCSNAFFFRHLHRELAEKGLDAEDLVGRTGVESVFEEFLRGKRGSRLVERDFRNQVQEVLGEAPSAAGHNVVLTIDSRFQRILEEEFDRAAGAAVFMDVRTGEVLAAGSFPTLDPNDLVPPISQETADRLYQNPARPVVNRVLASQYPLGSIFKVLTSVCLLDDHHLSPATQVACHGALFPESPNRFRCWARYGHGNLTIQEALQRSCNVFYYKSAEKAGHRPLIKWAQEFEFGVRPGSELRPFESAGLLPTSDWKRDRMGDSWYPGDTRNLSIGQGFLTVNPLQVVRMLAAIANGGKLLPARFVREVVTEDGDKVDFRERVPVRASRKLPISAATLSVIRKGLTDVVQTRPGTANKAFRGSPLVDQVAGKTSTAQTGRPDGNVGWFAGYYPSEAPEIAFAVVSEGLRREDTEEGDEEHGGDAAAPIVRRVLERYTGQQSESLTAKVE